MNHHTEEGRKETLCMVTGTAIHPFDPVPSEIEIEAIATGVSNECRWGGQMSVFYSVAEHSVMVSDIAYRKALIWGKTFHEARIQGLLGLLHDAAEGLGFRDLPTPIKRHIPEYERAEQRMLVAVLKKYVPAEIELDGNDFWKMSREVYTGDKIALYTERRDLRPEITNMPAWEPSYQPLEAVIVPVSPAEAKARWLARFDQLGGIQ